MRISCGPDPSRWGRRHKAAAQRGSELERSRRRFASRACRSHRPEWTAPLDRENPYGTACHQGLAGRLQYRGDLRGTSTARRPSTNTDPSKRSLAVAHRLGSEPRSDETRDPARSSATGRRQSDPGSRTIVTLLMQADFRVADNQIAASQNQAQLPAPERFGARAVIISRTVVIQGIQQSFEPLHVDLNCWLIEFERNEATNQGSPARCRFFEGSHPFRQGGQPLRRRIFGKFGTFKLKCADEQVNGINGLS